MPLAEESLFDWQPKRDSSLRLPAGRWAQNDGLRVFSYTLREVILHPIERRRQIHESLRPEMRLKLHYQCIALGFTRALDGHAALVIRRCSRRRSKFRARQSAQPRQCGPTQLKYHPIFSIRNMSGAKAPILSTRTARLKPCPTKIRTNLKPARSAQQDFTSPALGSSKLPVLCSTVCGSRL
jgi:hypothetical protein